jgi:predicted RNase H-like nuclease (RuvC/YqgF family)
MNKLVNLQSIRPNVSQLISLISNCLKKTLQYKNETRLIGAKLSQEE